MVSVYFIYIKHVQRLKGSTQGQDYLSIHQATVLDDAATFVKLCCHLSQPYMDRSVSFLAYNPTYTQFFLCPETNINAPMNQFEIQHQILVIAKDTSRFSEQQKCKESSECRNQNCSYGKRIQRAYITCVKPPQNLIACECFSIFRI